MKKEPLIYMIIHPITGQLMYVGQTVDFNERKECYTHNNKQMRESKQMIYDWLRKLRNLNLKPVFMVLEYVGKTSNLNPREIYWIDRLKPPLNKEKGGYYARGSHKYGTKYKYDLRKIRRMIRQGWTLKEIGLAFDCPKNIMGSFLRKNGLKTKNAENCNPDGSFISIPSRQVISKEELVDLYCNQLLSCNQIAKIKNCSGQAIKASLRKYDIPRRTQGESMKIRYSRGMVNGFREHDGKGNKKCQ